MKKFGKILLILGAVFALTSCADKNGPNYQYMPNMYEPVGYETYEKVDNGLFPDGTEAMLPAENTINREWMPYEFANDLEGRELARQQQSPLDSLNTMENLAEGAALYAIYCAVCHGVRGDGQGTLVKREKILGVPSYDDVARNITVGSTYHTMYYGLNSMGSYASQMDTDKELWQVSEYVMKLKEDLTK